MMTRSARVALLGVTAATVAAFVASTVSAREVVACGSKSTVGYFGPTTGPGAAIGEEMRNWSLLYAREWNRRGKRPRIEIIEGDTQFDPKEVSTLSQRFASDDDILAVIGPGASQEVLAAKPILKRAGLAYIAASATRASLTDGTNPTFFRIAAPDTLQARSTTDFMLQRLKVREVFVVDDQSSYSVPLADEVGRILRAAGVNVGRTSITQRQSDLSSVVTSIPASFDLVYLPVQLPAQMQQLGQQLREQGKRITLFASDAGYSPEFKIVGSYFSTFGPDVRRFAAAKPVLQAYFAEFGKNAPLTTFGPLGYIAGQVIVDAVGRACRDGIATRREVLEEVRRTRMAASIIGQPIRFTSRGDRIGARFFTFQITKAGPKTVR
jgi:branched-chain amino acid transport system substrate-binding protein